MYRRPIVPPQPEAEPPPPAQGVRVYRFLSPRFRPWATWGLTACIVLLFLVQAQVPDLVDRLSVDPRAIRDGEWWRIVTGALLHQNLLHLGFNAYFGWSIGARVERFVGAWRLLGVSAAAMLGSGVAIAVASRYPAVGFSGVLYGWLASWLAFHLTPRFPGLRLSGPQRTAYLQLLAANLLLSLLPGISLLAHLGGFVGGFAAAFALGRTAPPAPAS